METSELLRHQMIERLAAQHTGSVADAAVSLWARMASQLISIVGEGGFNSLYLRSVFLAQASYAWLKSEPASANPEQNFALLKSSLEDQTAAQAQAANILLLKLFTDILASLIGELLTHSILDAAWNGDHRDHDAKELIN